MHTEDNRDLRIVDELVDDLFNDEIIDTSDNFTLSVAFNFDHMDLLDKEVIVKLVDGSESTGTFIETINDLASIKVNDHMIKIKDIISMEEL